jgi:Tol biopolymer transport system component
LVAGGAALVGWLLGAWFAWKSVGPFYRPTAVAPFLAGGAAIAFILGILLGTLTVARRWLAIVVVGVALISATIPTAAVHTVSPLRQLVEHPLGDMTRAFAARPDNNGNVYLVHDGGVLDRMTDTAATEIRAELSPDRRHIAYSSNTSGSFDVFVMTIDEEFRSTGVRRITSLPGDEYVAHWSPDGSTISFESVVGNAWDVMAISPDGGELTALTTDGRSTGGAWSPDGALVAFAHPVEDQAHLGIWTMQPDGSNRRLLIEVPGNAYGASWSPDGTRILFSSDSSGNRDVWVADANGENAKNLTLGWDDEDEGIGWSPDGTVLFDSDRSHTGGNFVYAMRDDGTDVRLVVII